MKLKLYIPTLLHLIFTFLVLFVAIFFLSRIIFWLAYEPSSYPLERSDLLYSLWLGLRFDIRVAVAMILPLYFLGWIKFLNPLKNRVAKWLWISYFTLIFSAIALIYIVDAGHYAYLGKRVDFTAMRFLEDAYISAIMVWESYPVVWICIAWILSVGTVVLAIRAVIEHYTKAVSIKIGKIKMAIVILVSFLLLVILAYSKLSQYPLRWSDAAFSKHPFAATLTYNPVHYLFDTWKNGRVSYDVDEAHKYYPLIAEFLGVDSPDTENLNYLRERVSSGNTKPNLIIIIVESLASYKTSLSSNPLNPTPHIASLAQNGYYFKNFFTPSTGTARSIYTTITSTPDVELHGTSSRNPLIVDQHTIINDFDGYERYYFIGGSASWGNIRGILSKNIDNLHLYEEEDYNSKRNDVWGISDIDLFREANRVLKDAKEPFVAIIQTSGNHRPYTIPPKERAYGFKSIDIDEAEVKRYGFESLKELNAYRFMDYSIEHFSNLALKSGYMNNTILALWGDHGISGDVGEHADQHDSSSALGLGELRVPFIIYAPSLIKRAKVFDKVASETDVLPTLAALCDQNYSSTAMGRDLLDERYDQSRYAFTISHNNPPTIGMVSDRFYLKMSGDNSDAKLYDLHSKELIDDVSAQYPDIASKLKELTYGYYKTSQYIPYFNKGLRDE